MIRGGDEQRRWVRIPLKVLEYAFTGRTSAGLVKAERARVRQGGQFYEPFKHTGVICADDDSANGLRRTQIAHDMEDHWCPPHWNENLVTATSAFRNWVNGAAASRQDKSGKMWGVWILQVLVHVNTESLGH